MPASTATVKASKRPHSALSNKSTASDLSRGRSRRRKYCVSSFLSRLAGIGTSKAENEDMIELPEQPVPTRWHDGPETTEAPGAPRIEEAMDLSSDASSVEGTTHYQSLDEVVYAAADQDHCRQEGFEEDTLVMRSMTSESGGRSDTCHLSPRDDLTSNGSYIPRPRATPLPRHYVRTKGMSQLIEMSSLARSPEPNPPRQFYSNSKAFSSMSYQQQVSADPGQYVNHKPVFSSAFNQQHAAPLLAGNIATSSRYGNGKSPERPEESDMEMRTLWRAGW